MLLKYYGNFLLSFRVLCGTSAPTAHIIVS